MMFFLGMLVGGTAGFMFAAMAAAASADAEIRDGVDYLPQLPIGLQQGPMNTGRYAIITQSVADATEVAANNDPGQGRTGTRD